MTNSFFQTGTLNEVNQVLNSRVPYVLDATENPSTSDLGEVKGFWWKMNFYYRLASGDTQRIDNVRIVRDRNGHKFQLTPFKKPEYHKGVRTSPPTSGLQDGDAYRVGSPATGDFAGRSDSIAVYSTAYSWTYFSPYIPFLIFNQASKHIEHYDGTWNDGTGSVAIPNFSVTPQQLQNPGYIAGSGISLSPAPNPSVNDVYLIADPDNNAGSATGNWVNRTNYLAIWSGTTWLFARPKNNTTFRYGFDVRTYNGTRWERVGSEQTSLYYRRIDFSTGAVVPAGHSTNGKQRVLFSIPAADVPAEAEHMEIVIRDLEADLTVSFSQNIGRSGIMTRNPNLKFAVRVGDRNAATSLVPASDPHRLSSFAAGTEYLYDDYEPSFEREYIRFSDYPNKKVSLEILADADVENQIGLAT